MKALDIATELVETPFESTRHEAAALLRRQHEAIKVLREALEEIRGMHFAGPATVRRAKKALADT